MPKKIEMYSEKKRKDKGFLTERGTELIPLALNAFSTHLYKVTHG